jgi:hypothetical protein
MSAYDIKNKLIIKINHHLNLNSFEINNQKLAHKILILLNLNSNFD